MSTTPAPIPYDPQPADKPLHDVILPVKPSPADSRDYRPTAPKKKVGFAPNYSLPLVAPVVNQQNIGSCTANGLVGMVQTAHLLQGTAPPDLSRLYWYYEERAKEGTTGSDAGAYPRDGLLIGRNEGVAHEQFWPYNTARFTEHPPAEAYNDAPNYKHGDFFRIGGTEAIKTALEAGYVPGIAIVVYNSIRTSTNGIIPMPSPGEQPIGGHWLYTYGWQDEASWAGGGYFILRNSWGTRAGTNGDYYIPYAYIDDANLCFEAWYCYLTSDPTPPTPPDPTPPTPPDPTPPTPPDPTPDDASVDPVTGFRVVNGFEEFYLSFSEDQRSRVFGHILSNEFLSTDPRDGGRPVQYFRRCRLMWWGDNGAYLQAYGQMIARRYGIVAPGMDVIADTIPPLPGSRAKGTKKKGEPS